MPRQPRLDIPGLLQHVIVRGIERRPIFRDDGDRHDFVKRLSTLLDETGTDCFAWALIPNHFHLLLKPKRCDLKHFMHRLLTGYVVNFNRRHNRSGHLFHNRYKSIVCEEDVYLLELIRYIHLNPLRAGLVKDLEALGHFPWCGHGVMLGNIKMRTQNASEVLALFANHPTAARKLYWQFVADGVAQGNRSELVGGGLKRSCTHQPHEDEPRAFDERILGSADFVETLRNDNHLRARIEIRLDLTTLADRVANHFDINLDQLFGRSRDQTRREARDLFCYIAVRQLGYKGTQVGKTMGLQRAAVSHAVKRGELITRQEPEIVATILAPD